MISQQQQRGEILCWVGAPFLAALVALCVVIGCDDRRDQAILPAPQNPDQPQPAAQPAAPQRRVDFKLPTTRWAQLQTNTPNTLAFKILDTNPELIVQGLVLPRDVNVAALINDWEKQLGKPPSDASTIQSSIIKQRVVKGGVKAFVIELSSPDTATDKKHLLAAIVPDEQTVNVAFILAGAEAAVEAERANFDLFIDSVEFITAAPQNAGLMPAEPFNIRFQAPANWKSEQGNPAAGIDLVLRAPDGSAIVVSRQTIQAGQQYLNNPNILRAAAGLTALPAGTKQDAYQVQIGSQQGLMFDLRSNPGETPPKRTLFALVQQSTILVCVQLSGTVDGIEQHKQELNAFLQSLTFIPTNGAGQAAAAPTSAAPLGPPTPMGPPTPVAPSTAPQGIPDASPQSSPAGSPFNSPLRLN